MAEVIRDVIVRIALEQKKAELKVPGLEKETARVGDLQDAVKEMAASTVASNKKITESMEGVKRQQEEQFKLLQENRQALQDDSIKTVESFAAGAEGALIFTRGLTFLGIEAEDSLAQVTESLAKVQGGIDLLKGGVQTFKGLTEGMRAVQAASSGAAGGLANVVKGLNPATLAVTGVTLAVTAGVAAWAAWGSEAKAAGDDVEETGEQAKKTADEIQRANQAALDQAQGAFGKQAASRSLLEFRFAERQLTTQEKLAEVEQLRVKNQKDLVSLASLTTSADVAGIAAAGRLDEATKLSEQLVLQQALNSEGDLALEAAETLTRFREESLRIDRQRLGVLKEQEQAAQNLVEKARQETQAVKDKLEAERNRVQSLEERIGRLDPEQLQEFKQLSQKAAAGGQFTRGELRRLEELGGQGVQGFTSQGFAAFGQQSGGANIFAPFQGGQALTGQGSQLEALTQAFRDRQQVENQILQKQQEIQQQTQRASAAIVDAMEGTLRELLGLETFAQSVKDSQQKRAFNERGI